MSLVSITQDEICEQIGRLPLSARVYVVQSVMQSLANDLPREQKTKPFVKEREFGFLKTKIEMSEDFDEPLECMAEYMG